MLSVVEGSAEGGFVPLPPTPPAPIQRLASRLLPPRKDIEDEIDGIIVRITQLCTMEPDQALREVSALSARCTELAVHLHRVEARDRDYTRIRTMQIHPVLDELKTQKEIAKGMIEMRRQDLQLMA